MKGLILSLCDYSGVWSQPYAEAGYDVRRFDLQHGQDVRLLEHIDVPVRGILAAPPCTHFSRAGARHWKRKGCAEILDGLSVVDACLRAVAIYRPQWWVLENPIGRLQKYLGPPQWKFDPYQFGDPYTKRTWLWGIFTPPLPLFSRQARKVVAPVFRAAGGLETTVRKANREPLAGAKFYCWTDMISSSNRNARSRTPDGFASAFFEANP